MDLQRKPKWMRVKMADVHKEKALKKMLNRLSLNTVCQEANCPNRIECYGKKTATFMILGKHCTRNCQFCNVTHHEAEKVDQDEPKRIAEAVKEMGLLHVVITSVTRDDLEDGGASHFALVIEEVRKMDRKITIEVLIPDFLGSSEALKIVVDAKPDIINHNVETVPRLYKGVRPQGVYERSLNLLKHVKLMDKSIFTKSGIMVGLGEKKEEVHQVMDDLRNINCDFLTVGQYLPPSKEHYPMERYVTPEEFDEYKKEGEEKGFSFIASAPLVRSSYKAVDMINAAEGSQ